MEATEVLTGTTRHTDAFTARRVMFLFSFFLFFVCCLSNQAIIFFFIYFDEFQLVKHFSFLKSQLLQRLRNKGLKRES